MKIAILVITHNCADVLPFFLRHYSAFADEIWAWDDKSEDGTRQLLRANPKVVLRDWPHNTGIDEDLFLEHWKQSYPVANAAGFDWVMIVDPDEMLYAEDIRFRLKTEMEMGTEVVGSTGYNMTGEGLPKDDGRQIWEIAQNGVAAPVYSKPVCFRPHIPIGWVRGKHALEGCNPVMSYKPWLKLLHYRYMGADYTRAKNAKNYARCGLLSGDKGAAWSCSPGYDGPDKEHSPQWAEFAKTKAFNVIKA